MPTLFYPSTDSAPSIKTIFVDGYKFDICEVSECHYDLLAPSKFKKPTGRFFVMVEDNFIVNYKFCEQLHLVGCENRWDMFCGAKSDCISIVNQFEEALVALNSKRVSLIKNPLLAYSLQPKIEFSIQSILTRYNLKV